jgi:hypothetical protein
LPILPSPRRRSTAHCQPTDSRASFQEGVYEELKRAGGETRSFATARVGDPGLVAELKQGNLRFARGVENTWLSCHAAGQITMALLLPL